MLEDAQFSALPLGLKAVSDGQLSCLVTVQSYSRDEKDCSFMTNPCIYDICKPATQREAEVRWQPHSRFHLETASLNDQIANPNCGR